MEKLELNNICESKCNCCSDKIYRSINKYAAEWKKMSEMTVANSPLHEAAAKGNTAVAVEILNVMPWLGLKLNEEGLSPLHLAIEREHKETVERLVRFEKQLVRVKGKGGETPLMQCVGNVRLYDRKLLATLLLACPESVKDVNNNYQTVVHVALANNNSNAVCILLDWLGRRDQISLVLSVRDLDGNTALHAAAQFGCDLKVAKKLVDRVKLNRLNLQNKTPLDIAKENHQIAVAEMLEKNGARRGIQILKNKRISGTGTSTSDDDINSSSSSVVDSTIDYVLNEPTRAESFSRAYYYLTKNLTLEMRGIVLVVATLIVATTYQAVLQPPGGVYPPPSEEISSALNSRRRAVSNGELWRQHLAGQMVMEKAHYRYFMPSNTFAFALSAVIIIFVVPGTPLFLIVHFCLVFMCVSYLLALDAISAYNGISDMIYVMALYAIVGAYIVKLCYYPVKALLVDEDWWLRRISVKFANWSSRSRWGSGAAMQTATRIKKQHYLLAL